MTKHPHVKKALAYCRGVISGKILACRWVKLACQRHLDDLERAKDGWEYYFDPEKAEKFCRFIELLPHTKGKWFVKKLKIELEPWQCFIVCSIFGWLQVADDFRRFRTAMVMVPRKNGKSLLAAAIGLAMLLIDGEGGAEIYSGATSEKQAFEVFTPARLMVKRSPKLIASFGVTVNKQNLHVAGTGSKFEPVIGNPGAGPSPTCGIADEYHEHKTAALYSTFETGMMARDQPLMLPISTAGVDLSGPCYAMQVDCQHILEGTVTDETTFAIIYGIDKDDHWSDDESLEKANPNYGVSINIAALKKDRDKAVRDARVQNAFKTMHLNVWASADVSWMNMEWWARQCDPELELENFVGMSCYAAFDLSTKLDMTSVALWFRIGIENYVFTRHYLPRDTVKDPSKQHYHGWEYDGHLTVTNGARIDIAVIEQDIRDDLDIYRVQQVGHDPWGATGIEQRLTADGATMIEIPQNVKHLSDPMKEFEALVKDGHLWHDGNPILTWMISNVVCHEDKNNNILPNKANAANKIDGASAAIMALSRCMMAEPEPEPITPERRAELAEKGIVLL